MSERFTRVTLPRLTRPNLVARFYMMFTALGTASVAWAVPGSTIARIMESGGIAAHIVVGIILTKTFLGFADIAMNDLLVMQERADGLVARFARWLEDRRTQRCFIVGGCYLVLTYAGIGSPVTGTFWLLVYYLQMSFCSGLLAWSLRALTLAEAVGGRDATA